MNARNAWLRVLLVLTMGVMVLAFTVGLSAQVQTTQSTSSGQHSKEVQVERGEVVLVDGNDLIVKMEDGTIRHIANVPESARVTVDGRELGIHDLKPGMKLQRTITTTTTPKLITTVQTVTGKVWHVSPPSSVILTLENGQNQQFKIPKDQKFNVNGEMVDAWHLKKGMTVTATKVTEEPVTDIAVQKQLSGTMPPPPPPDTPVVIAMAPPTPAPVAEPVQAAQAELPKTGSELPTIALLGCLLLAAGALSRLLRTLSHLA